MIYANAAATYCILNEDACKIETGWDWFWLIFIIVISVAIIWWCED